MAGKSNEIYFEFIRVGTAVKVIAVDANSGTEVSIMGPANSPQTELQAVALQKLKKRMRDLGIS